MQGYITLALVVSKQIKTRQIKMFEFVSLEAQFRLGELNKKAKPFASEKAKLIYKKCRPYVNMYPMFP